MPKVVDHDRRRSEIARAVLRLVSSDGVGNVTMRSAATAAGWSTGVLTHYFGDKRGLLTAAVREAGRTIGTLFGRAHGTNDALRRVELMLEAGLPLDDDRSAMCRIFFYFWSEGLRDGDLGGELATYYAWWRFQVRIAIEAAQSEGWFTGVPAEEIATALVGLADGLGVQSMFDSAVLDPQRLAALVSVTVRQLAGSGGSR